MDSSWEWFFVPPRFGVNPQDTSCITTAPTQSTVTRTEAESMIECPWMQTWIQRQTNDDHQLVMAAYIEMISTLLNRIRAMFNAISSCLVSMDTAYSHPSTQHSHWIKHIPSSESTGKYRSTVAHLRKKKKKKTQVWFGRQCPFLTCVMVSFHRGSNSSKEYHLVFKCFYDPESIGYLIAHTLQMFHSFF